MSNFKNRRTANRIIGPRRVLKSKAEKLAGSERQGLFIDFTDRSIVVRDATTQANRLSSLPDVKYQRDSASAFFTTNGPSPKMVRHSDGLVKFAPHNLCLQSETFGTTWVTNHLAVSENATVAPNGTLTADKFNELATTGPHRVSQAITTVSGMTYAFTVYAKQAQRTWFQLLTSAGPGGNSGANFDLANGVVGTVVTNVTPFIEAAPYGFYKCTIVFTASGSGSVFAYCRDGDTALNSNYAGTSNSGIFAWGAQLRGTPSDAIYIPTVDSAAFALPYDYSVANGCEGVLLETQRTNLCLRSDDLTNASWTKSNMTTAKTATGPGGVANSATICTATAANATALQAITSGSAARITSVYLKRRTGTGNIDLTQDNGSTWATQTLTSAWERFEIASVTSANPTVGIRIVTSGDEVDVEMLQHEVGASVSSGIPTTTATVTRSADTYRALTSTMPTYSTDLTIAAEVKVPVQLDSVGRSIVNMHTTTDSAEEFLSYRGSSFDDFTLYGATIAIDNGAITANVYQKVAGVIATNNSAMYVDGAAAGTDLTSTAMASRTTFCLGHRVSGDHLLGHIKSLRILPRRWMNAEAAKETQR